MIHLTPDPAILTIAPQWSQIDNIVLAGAGVAALGILSEWCMNTRINHVGSKDVAKGIKYIGYGVGEIVRNVFRCSFQGIDLTEGGGGSWVERNDFFCPAWAIAIGALGGNSWISRNVFNRQDAVVSTGDLPIAVRIITTSGSVRSLKITETSFAG